MGIHGSKKVMADGDFSSPVDAASVVDEAIGRYMAGCRRRVASFVDSHYSFGGSLALHRHALGWDLVRAPINAVGSIGTAGKSLLSLGLRAGGATTLSTRLDRIHLFLETDLGRELNWRLHTELLHLPLRQPGREYLHDALLLEVLRDRRINRAVATAGRAVAGRLFEQGFDDRLSMLLKGYVGTRAAAGDIAVSLTAAGLGTAAFHRITPGVAAFSSSMAGAISRANAIAGFWAGPWAGRLYYGFVGVATPPVLTATVFATLVVPAAVLANFAGLVADPLQRRLGIHQRRLGRLLDAVEARLRGQGDAPFPVREHYLARVLDVLDWAQALARLAR